MANYFFPALAGGVQRKPCRAVNLTHDAEIRVVIISNSGFDAIAGLDTTSLKFGPSGNEAAPFLCSASGEDINGDGLRDLACYFNPQETGFQVGDTEGTLKGRTIEGADIIGTDSVQIVSQ